MTTGRYASLEKERREAAVRSFFSRRNKHVSRELKCDEEDVSSFSNYPYRNCVLLASHAVVEDLEYCALACGGLAGNNIEAWFKLDVVEFLIEVYDANEAKKTIHTLFREGGRVCADRDAAGPEHHVLFEFRGQVTHLCRILLRQIARGWICALQQGGVPAECSKTLACPFVDGASSYI